MAKTGRTMADAERATRTFLQQLRYCIEMTCKCNWGGARTASESGRNALKERIAAEFRGNTALAVADLHISKMEAQMAGVRTRQKHACDEFRRRIAELEEVVKIVKQEALNQPDCPYHQTLLRAVEGFINGGTINMLDDSDVLS
ncbi:MAG: hypothetical protein ACYTG0_06680 [Planctomycetota bacterium]|jgi:hypothetical protein